MTIPERIARIENECRGVWGQSGVTSWERERLQEWSDKTYLSPKQHEILTGIERKVFGGDDD